MPSIRFYLYDPCTGSSTTVPPQQSRTNDLTASRIHVFSGAFRIASTALRHSARNLGEWTLYSSFLVSRKPDLAPKTSSAKSRSWSSVGSRIFASSNMLSDLTACPAPQNVLTARKGPHAGSDRAPLATRQQTWLLWVVTRKIRSVSRPPPSRRC